MRIVDKSNQFVLKNSDLMGKALEKMARDIILVAKIRVPFKAGDLMKEFRTARVSQLRYRAQNDKEYAAYQERGMRADGTRVVKKYTTPNTNKDFLKDAGKKISRSILNYFRQAASQTRV